jgi:crotonobetainyl-CoA:carnitine CoA-transferase CaiB-like acyl-CoA transferase
VISARETGKGQSIDLAQYEVKPSLLQMCKAELLQKLAMEATTSALGNGPAQINADFASLSQAYSSDAARMITMAKTA